MSNSSRACENVGCALQLPPERDPCPGVVARTQQLREREVDKRKLLYAFAELVRLVWYVFSGAYLDRGQIVFVCPLRIGAKSYFAPKEIVQLVQFSRLLC